VTELLTVAEVADRLRVSRRTVERLMAQGRLRPLKVGRRTLVTSRELDAFVAHQEGAGRRGRMA
jgi:excisionase family DNA binding protein